MDTEETNQDLKKEHQHKITQVIEEVGKVVVGQKHMVNRLLIGLFTQNHILLEGVYPLKMVLQKHQQLNKPYSSFFRR